jgi:adenylate cyclase
MAEVQRTGLPCVILFADVCRSTELYEAVGNARAQAAVAQMFTTLSQSIARHLGRIVKTIGDELMCVFSTAREAMEAAVDMQRSVKQAGAVQNIDVRSLAVRVGFHYGPVISQGTDVFGDAVNVAARVVAHAKPGQILLTKETARELPKIVEANVRFVGSTQVKGKTEPVDLFEVIWDRENLTQARSIIEPRSEHARLSATLGNTTIELGNSRPVLHMGRGLENEFVVSDPLASRVHARIEHRRGHFFLIDQSLNGTYLQVQGMPEIVLRRDEIALESSGLISLGQPTADKQNLCVRFTVQRGS